MPYSCISTTVPCRRLNRAQFIFNLQIKTPYLMVVWITDASFCFTVIFIRNSVCELWPCCFWSCRVPASLYCSPNLHLKNISEAPICAVHYLKLWTCSIEQDKPEEPVLSLRLLFRKGDRIKDK